MREASHNITQQIKLVRYFPVFLQYSKQKKREECFSLFLVTADGSNHAGLYPNVFRILQGIFNLNLT